MIKNKQKACKGINKAKGHHGCGELKLRYKYGLCHACFFKWLNNTPEGQEMQPSVIKKALNSIRKVDKDKKKEDRQIKRESNEKKAMLLADIYFSRYIRLAYSNYLGKCTCYTCGIIKDIKEVDNGHYMKRAHKSTRYHEDNCRPQCKTCNGNTLHNGKQVEFRINLVNEIGLDMVESIEFNSKQSIKANYLWYKSISDYYRIKVNDLQKELGVKYW